MRHVVLLLSVLFAGCQSNPAPARATTATAASAPATPPLAAAPATKKVPVTDTYHGVQVTDDYRWLENTKDPAVQAWTKAQDDRARTWLHALPEYKAIHVELETAIRGKTPRYRDVQVAGDLLFVSLTTPSSQQRVLEVAPIADPAKLRVLVDPTKIDPSGKTRINWYMPDPNGRRVAVCLAQGPWQPGDVHVYDVASGKQTGEVVPRAANDGGAGSVAWAPDGKGFYYTRSPQEGKRPAADPDAHAQIRFHALGTSPDHDRYEIGKDFPHKAYVLFQVDSHGGLVLASVEKGDGDEYGQYLRGADGKWRQIADHDDQVSQAVFSADGRSIDLVSYAGAPRGRVLRMSVSDPDAKAAKTLIPQAADSIAYDYLGPSLLEHAGRLYVLYGTGGTQVIRAFSLDGQPAAGPSATDVASMEALRPAPGGALLFLGESFLVPPAWFRFDAATNTTTKTALASPPLADLAGLKVVREEAKSKDGTEIPVDILEPAGFAKDGSGRCAVIGVGSFDQTLPPIYAFTVLNSPLLKRGLCVAAAHLRGGGDLGEGWHHQGMLTHKQNTFDDFHAVLQHLVDAGYASHAHIAVYGGFGVLGGALLVQHPDDAGVVVATNGFYDMLRLESSPVAAGDTTEFGSVKDPDQFRAMFAYSPYHHVVDGTRYPPVLLISGEHDTLSPPWQSWKMAARLQAAQAARGSILLRNRSNSGSGYGGPIDSYVEARNEEEAFILHFLGTGSPGTSSG